MIGATPLPRQVPLPREPTPGNSFPIAVNAPGSFDATKVRRGRLLIWYKAASLRINDQWRICFHWTSAGPEDVEIVDYH